MCNNLLELAIFVSCKLFYLILILSKNYSLLCRDFLNATYKTHIEQYFSFSCRCSFGAWAAWCHQYVYRHYNSEPFRKPTSNTNDLTISSYSFALKPTCRPYLYMQKWPRVVLATTWRYRDTMCSESENRLDSS